MCELLWARRLLPRAKPLGCGVQINNDLGCTAKGCPWQEESVRHYGHVFLIPYTSLRMMSACSETGSCAEY